MSLAKLREEKAKLMKLAAKHQAVLAEKRKKQMEEQRLKKEIAELKMKAGKGFFLRAKRARDSPETRQAIKKGKKMLKSIDKFIRKLPG